MKLRNILLIVTPTVLLATGCNDIFFEEPANNPEAVFDNLWVTFNEEYAIFEERQVDWQALYQDYRPLVTENTPDDELFTVLSGMLSHLDDGHVNLIAPNRETFNANYLRENKIGDELFDQEVVKEHYLEVGFKTDEEGSYVSGKIAGQNIGYIRFDYVGPNWFQLEDFLEANENSAGLIIDLRHNSGGDFTFSFSEIGRLVDQKRLVFESKTKNGKGENDFTPWHQWYIEPKGDYVDKPVVVLTDRYTISAGERATMAFKALPNVTLAGDTTSGAHGTMIGRELANGWAYSLVPQKTKMFDGQSYEGIGIAPEVVVKNTPGEMRAGIDASLEKAIELILDN